MYGGMRLIEFVDTAAAQFIVQRSAGGMRHSEFSIVHNSTSVRLVDITEFIFTPLLIRLSGVRATSSAYSKLDCLGSCTIGNTIGGKSNFQFENQTI